MATVGEQTDDLVLICTAPPDSEVLARLQKHFAERFSVRVVGECRTSDRRTGPDRRRQSHERSPVERRRRPIDRRTGERRASAKPVDPPPGLPVEIESEIEAVRFYE